MYGRLCRRVSAEDSLLPSSQLESAQPQLAQLRAFLRKLLQFSQQFHRKRIQFVHVSLRATTFGDVPPMGLQCLGKYLGKSPLIWLFANCRPVLGESMESKLLTRLDDPEGLADESVGVNESAVWLPNGCQARFERLRSSTRLRMRLVAPAICPWRDCIR